MKKLEGESRARPMLRGIELKPKAAAQALNNIRLSLASLRGLNACKDLAADHVWSARAIHDAQNGVMFDVLQQLRKAVPIVKRGRAGSRRASKSTSADGAMGNAAGSRLGRPVLPACVAAHANPCTDATPQSIANTRSQYEKRAQGSRHVSFTASVSAPQKHFVATVVSRVSQHASPSRGSPGSPRRNTPRRLTRAGTRHDVSRRAEIRHDASRRDAAHATRTHGAGAQASEPFARQ